MKGNLEWQRLVGWGIIILSLYTVGSTQQHIMNLQGGSFKTKVAIFHRTKTH